MSKNQIDTDKLNNSYTDNLNYQKGKNTVENKTRITIKEYLPSFILIFVLGTGTYYLTKKFNKYTADFKYKMNLSPY
jgi:hypothetical protein